MYVRSLFVIGLFLSLAAAPLHAQEWTRLRGPNGQGVSNARTIPVKFAESDFNWKVKLPGEGHGSPVLWGDKVFVVSADKGTAERMVTCLDAASGQAKWTKSFKSNTHDMHGFNHYGTCTPAVDADRVYTYFGSDKNSVLLALDHDGNKKWSADLGPFIGKHGPACSPMRYKDLVIVTHDQDPSGAVYAFDAKTGDKRWTAKRNGADNGASYGVPIVYTNAAGKDRLIVSSRGNGLTALDPASGGVVWELGDLLSLRSVANVVIAGDTLFTQSGSGGGGKQFFAVQVKDDDAKVRWETKRTIPYVPTPVVYNGYLYYFTDGAQVACMNPADGEVKWMTSLGQGLGFFGSPVCIDGKLYALSKDGRCVVVKASPDKFELLAINNLGELSYATPAVSGGRMYLRTLTHLISVGGQKLN